MNSNLPFSRKTLLLGIPAALLIHAAQAPAGTGSSKPATPDSAPAFPFADSIVTFDLEERTRFEVRNNNRDFDHSISDDNDDAWLLNRFRLGAAVKPESWLKFYAQSQDTREWNSKRANIPGVRGTEGGDAFDLRQAYFQVADPENHPLGFTLGRQILSYGDQRLVADSRWGNFGRTFDALKLRLETKEFWADAFVARPVQIKRDVFNDSDSADNFYGLYGSSNALKFQSTDWYLLYRDKEDHQPDLDPTNRWSPLGTWSGPAQRTATIGTRWKSNKALADWDYTIEGAFQFGDVWTGDRSGTRLEHHAYAVHSSGGYTWKDAIWTPRLGIAYSHSSGDHDPSDSWSGSFQNLYPSNHAKFGDMDEFGWRNVHHIRLPLTLRPTKRLELEIAYNAAWLADTHDYWYRSNGVSTLRTRTSGGADVRLLSASSFAGQEIDLNARWKAADWLNVDAGYAHFIPGAYLQDTGPADDADFGYLSVQIVY